MDTACTVLPLMLVPASTLSVKSELFWNASLHPVLTRLRGVMNEFGVGHAAAALGLSIYVIGCMYPPITQWHSY